MDIDTAYFLSVEGSQTSEDGKTFMLRVKRATGRDLLLGFPHAEIPNIIENAVTQSAHARTDSRRHIVPAFVANAFQIANGPDGEAVLTLVVSQGARINVLLPQGMAQNLTRALWDFTR